jgi:hypothetical protein
MDSFWTPTRAFALLVVLAHVVLAYGSLGPMQALCTLVLCSFPLLCIWIPEALSGWFGYGSGWVFRRGFTGDTPPVMVSIGGWVLLVAMSIAALIRLWNG